MWKIHVTCFCGWWVFFSLLQSQFKGPWRKPAAALQRREAATSAFEVVPSVWCSEVILSANHSAALRHMRCLRSNLSAVKQVKLSAARMYGGGGGWPGVRVELPIESGLICSNTHWLLRNKLKTHSGMDVDRMVVILYFFNSVCAFGWEQAYI